MKKRKFEIIFEDDFFMVINKPPGLLTIPDRYDDTIPNLYTILSKLYDEVFIVHRLDKDTSGLIIFAKTKEAHRNLCLAFENHEVTKQYFAILKGVPQFDSGEITKPLKTGGKKVKVMKEGKEAKSSYEVIEKFRNYSLVKVDIQTGRTHQIRVHFQSIGCPLMVDSKYGFADAFYLSEIKGRKYKKNRDDVESPLIYRNSLHSWKLSLKHPVNGELMNFEAELAKDLKAVTNQLRKYNN